MMQHSKRFAGPMIGVRFILFLAMGLMPILAVRAEKPAGTGDYKSLISTGKQLQAAKKYEEAYRYFKKASTLKKSGEAYYCLGNILIDLRNYEKAIDYYELAYIENYQANNCLFNIACAYSLNKDPRAAMEILLNNYREGDRLTERIENDPDLLNFRKSAYYEKYKQILGRLSDGIVPETGDDILKYLFKFNQVEGNPDSSSNLGILTDPSPGFVHFYRDNKFYFQEGTVAVNAGSWQIDEKNKLFILSFLGVAYPGRYTRQDKTTFSGECFDKTDDLYFENRPKEWKRCVIPFKDIRLNVLSIVNPPQLGVHGILANYNMFGDQEKNKFTLNVGWYIKD